ncbi:hypothetical protein EWM64_g10600 [Hericium alpestre]|uniref:Uncharacterized protein n=1 Tax=Hericium alpestre TaxID=135208 RepID=A0A4Y9ZHW1_9AGAM|nr:hypothetical protein EWM64_g10600 [Hericium alpestre]
MEDSPIPMDSPGSKDKEPERHYPQVNQWTSAKSRAKTDNPPHDATSAKDSKTNTAKVASATNVINRATSQGIARNALSMYKVQDVDRHPCKDEGTTPSLNASQDDGRNDPPFVKLTPTDNSMQTKKTLMI